MAGRLGDILVDKGYLTDAQLEDVLSQRDGGRLGEKLLRLGYVNTDQLGDGLSQQFDVDYRKLTPQSVHPQVVQLVPESFARRELVVPLSADGSQLTLAMESPDDIETLSEVELMTGYDIRPVVSMAHDIQSAIDIGFDDRIVARQTVLDLQMAELRERPNEVQEEEDEDHEEAAAPVVRLVRAILTGAINAGTSDIHLEPHTPEMRVRYRVDGELQQVMTIPNHIEDAMIARIKIMADMDTTESRRPQDGKLSLTEDGKRVGFRVSIVPTIDGEKVVMRLLEEGNSAFSLDTIGFSDVDRTKVESMLDKPHGMIVVTGPTGSGKSTSMYAMLTSLNRIESNIVTVEDPVEFRLQGINQVQSNNDFGMGFANALKFIMRQDPDVIMVGEIRDHETATTAVQAALTGHLLISTLHTNDAVGAVTRMNDLGIDSFKIGGSLLGSIAQRLVRGICPECRVPDQPTPGLVEKTFGTSRLELNAPLYRGAGCDRCLGTGYSGRIPIHEVMAVTPRVAQAIEAGLPHTQLREVAIDDGMTELLDSGLMQALAGRTTLEEVYFKTSG